MCVWSEVVGQPVKRRLPVGIHLLKRRAHTQVRPSEDPLPRVGQEIRQRNPRLVIAEGKRGRQVLHQRLTIFCDNQRWNHLESTVSTAVLMNHSGFAAEPFRRVLHQAEASGRLPPARDSVPPSSHSATSAERSHEPSLEQTASGVLSVDCKRLRGSNRASTLPGERLSSPWRPT